MKAPASIHSAPRATAKSNILSAAIRLIRIRGYNATTIDDICGEAAVTKGSFFHHFRSKDDLALSAIAEWRTTTEAFFASAPYHNLPDPVDRLLGYLDFRASILEGEPAEYTCLLGTFVQETYQSHPVLRAACEQALASHVRQLAADIEEAKKLHRLNAAWTAESLGYYIQSVLQGSFIFAKAQYDPEVIREALRHLRRYVCQLFGVAEQPEQAGIEVLAAVPHEAEQKDELDDEGRSHFVD